MPQKAGVHSKTPDIESLGMLSGMFSAPPGFKTAASSCTVIIAHHVCHVSSLRGKAASWLEEVKDSLCIAHMLNIALNDSKGKLATNNISTTVAFTLHEGSNHDFRTCTRE